MPSYHTALAADKAGVADGANRTIDLRSDTVTRPSPGMIRAMAEAATGDDVFGDDPTTNALEERVAELLGKEAALFTTSGTQSNLLALMAHCARGEEFICGDRYHVYSDEAGGAGVLGSAVACPLPTLENGSLDPAAVDAAVKPDDVHCPVTRLLSIENTVHGRPQPLDRQDALVAVARRHGLAVHLDGARLMNAAVALGLPAGKIVENVDTVSLCLSKGLGTPLGTVLSGPKDFIKRARRIRKMVGGGMRQVGVVAAAGLYALDHNIERMAEDHDNARHLAEGLGNVPGIEIAGPVETNMVFLRRTKGGDHADLQRKLAERGIVILGGDTLRWVVHLDIDRAKVDAVIAAVAEIQAAA
ncbi:MAG: low-specificity L-threonine aldolase [Rhodospirillales bacterium]